MAQTRTPRVGSERVLRPVGLLDMCNTRVSSHTGHRVKLTQPSGCPKNGTIGMAYVTCVDCSGQQPFFVGLVCVSSLTKEG